VSSNAESNRHLPLTTKSHLNSAFSVAKPSRPGSRETVPFSISVGGSRLEKGTMKAAAVLVTDNLTKKGLEDLRLSLLESPAYDISSIVYAVDIIDNMNEHVFLCSLPKVPASRVEGFFTGFSTHWLKRIHPKRSAATS
jgi:hypothetical protein